jgi:hypothetical protein
MDASNTGENRKPKPGTFEKGAGKDPRINRKGRPKSFDAVRALFQSIAQEPIVQKDGTHYVIDNHIVTIIEGIGRSWATSKNGQMQKAFVEVAYGQVPSVTRLEGQDGGPIQVQHEIEIKPIDYREAIASLAPSEE